MTKNTTPSRAVELSNLDLVRAVAVLFVLTDHTLVALLHIHDGPRSMIGWLGRLGVLFFFVHTACVLMMSLDRHRGDHPFRDFYVRRAFRIYPLSIVAVLLVAILGLNPDLHAKSLLANVFLVQNLTFSVDAFPTIWTLPIEVQMYVVLPFIYELVRRVRSVSWIVPVVILVVSIVLSLWLPRHIGRASVVKFAPNFLPGVLAFCIYRIKVRQVYAGWLLLLIGAITSLFVMHPGWGAPAWIACSTLGLCLPFIRPIRAKAVNRVTSVLARYSYGIYIVHSLILMRFQPTWKTLPSYFILVAIGSVLAYHLIEKPFLEIGARVTRKHRILAQELVS